MGGIWHPWHPPPRECQNATVPITLPTGLLYPLFRAVLASYMGVNGKRSFHMALITEARFLGGLNALADDVNKLAGIMGSRVGLIMQRMTEMEKRIAALETGTTVERINELENNHTEHSTGNFQPPAVSDDLGQRDAGLDGRERELHGADSESGEHLGISGRDT